MRLVDDQHLVGAELAVALDLGEQDAVGHHLDEGVLADPVVEAHGEADRVADLGAELLGDALRHRPRRQPPRLRVADEAAHAEAELEAQLRELGALARAGLAGDDHDLVVADRLEQRLPVRDHRQVGVGGRGQPRPPPGDPLVVGPSRPGSLPVGGLLLHVGLHGLREARARRCGARARRRGARPTPPPCAGRGTPPADRRDSSPASSASAMAQPGSPAWPQSAKWHSSPSSSMSAKVASTDSSSPARPDLADAGRVDHHAAAGELVELAVRGGVATLARRPSRTAPTTAASRAEHRVHEPRLAGARLAEHHRGVPGQPIAQRVDAEPGDRRHDEPLEPGVLLVDRGDDRVEPSSARSALVSTRSGWAPASHASASPRWIRPAVTGRSSPHDEQHEVEVGGEELVVVAARGPAAQQRGPVEQPEHRLAVEGEPVADGERLDAAAELDHPLAGRGAPPAPRRRRGGAPARVRPRRRARRAARPSDR